MSTYQELKGLKIKYLSSDTSGDRAKEGEVFYNSTTGKAASHIASSAWSSTSLLGTARQGGGGAGATGPGVGTNGTANTGGGAGGSNNTASSATGGSGIIILRIPTACAPGSLAAAPGTNTITVDGSCKVATFTVTGTLTVQKN